MNESSRLYTCISEANTLKLRFMLRLDVFVCLESWRPILIMWKEGLLTSKFPFTPKSEEDAENILFKDSPERIILLKWIYNLIDYNLSHGSKDNISKQELAEYFLGLGIVDGDPLKFVEGSYPKEHQKKIWKNLFQFSSMMMCTSELCKSFVDKHQHEMSIPYSIADEPHVKTSHSSLHLDLPDWDSIIAELKEQLAQPINISISEENTQKLERLRDYIEKFSPIKSNVRIPEPEEIRKQKELGNSIESLCTTLQTLETVLMSSNPLVSSMKQLEMNLDKYKSKSEAIFTLVGKLKGVNRDIV